MVRLCMGRLFKFAAATVLIFMLTHEMARADFWARTDRPWTYWEVKQAVHYCRVYPRVSGNISTFVDLVVGREIDKCMYTLGWIGVAR